MTFADDAGRSVTIDVVFDSGFNGFLALPASQITALGLPQDLSTEVILADGIAREAEAFVGLVVLDGELLEVPVTSLDGDPLAGMSLFAGWHVGIDVAPGGRVVATRLPGASKVG